jgi:hypothetical protein
MTICCLSDDDGVIGQTRRIMFPSKGVEERCQCEGAGSAWAAELDSSHAPVAARRPCTTSRDNSCPCALSARLSLWEAAALLWYGAHSSSPHHSDILVPEQTGRLQVCCLRAQPCLHTDKCHEGSLLWTRPLSNVSALQWCAWRPPDLHQRTHLCWRLPMHCCTCRRVWGCIV